MHPLYEGKSLLLLLLLLLPDFFINAPFGRFTPSTNSVFLLDGIHSWIFMELAAPIALIHALAHTPLATSTADIAPLTSAPLLFTALFLMHYANRALLSPLRTPSRSKAHVSVTLCGVFFNIVNGTLIGTYLRSPTASAFFATPVAARPAFWVGITLWAAGFVGNVFHDEILLNIRRNARAKGKARAKSPSPPATSSSCSLHKKQQREYYSIPHGYLYTYISYPNYFCEWIEWFGFALAAAALPDVSSLSALVDSVQPPWIFFLAEVCLMIGRAYKGHQWYLRTFPDYPKDRRVVIPFVF
ncbi:3-oxo-5-alpha-steroid 4-dehydrogenase-domain-containing protein [Boletus reticuloceps]|uniref:3-oxo-5-alpha-steroid 4-dehydrogenase-domain-containing protein n=1 Tax=Boletus reticuloceps TaxID=495285 RepID=A0A8I2Z1D3_9AGAM|nr:3-oxo-5-alpha-steroid 4-dehydrogenase-domain-containing protein [Boletus reticuloceps]